MNNTPFKTPSNHYLKRNLDQMQTPKFRHERSDSEESITSESSTGSSNLLTIVAVFDDLIRLMKYKRDRKTDEAFENFAEQSKLLLLKFCEIDGERLRLQEVLDKKTHECSEYEKRINMARQILDEEKKRTRRVLREKEELESQLDQVRDLLLTDNRMKIGEEAQKKLSFLTRNQYNGDSNRFPGKNLSCIHELNSTGSMLSDFSVSRTEEDLDSSSSERKVFRQSRHSLGVEADPPVKKRRSSTNKVIEIGPNDVVKATTTLTVNNKGPITATSVIESHPHIDIVQKVSSDDGIGSTGPSGPLSTFIFENWAKNRSSVRCSPTLNHGQRQHTLQNKTMIVPDNCTCCEKRIRFGKTALKCKECRSICHEECVDRLPLPCVPVVNTPSHKNILNIISDYAPTISPMVPALIIHCVNEIELRGLNELGLYRISASEKDVKSLKEKFLKGRGSPSLAQIDIHVICGCVKDFLRMLNEPLVTYGLWHDFVRAVEAEDNQDTDPALYQCISELPQPNRDTLAYIMLHLQKVAESPECKMPIDNLAKVFGPTLVGFSSDNPNPGVLLDETRKQIMVVNRLIRLPSDYWSKFINVNNQPPRGLQQTPSTDSLMYSKNRFFNSGSARMIKKRKRIFHTPPSHNR